MTDGAPEEHLEPQPQPQDNGATPAEAHLEKAGVIAERIERDQGRLRVAAVALMAAVALATFATLVAVVVLVVGNAHQREADAADQARRDREGAVVLEQIFALLKDTNAKVAVATGTTPLDVGPTPGLTGTTRPSSSSAPTTAPPGPEGPQGPPGPPGSTPETTPPTAPGPVVTFPPDPCRVAPIPVAC